MKKTIAIIGLGCSGTMILRQLAETLHANENVQFLLFEKHNELGSGTVYGGQYNDDAFLINMRSYLMSTNQNNLMEFDSWLAAKYNMVSIRGNYPYVKRSDFGEYLRHIVANALLGLKNKTIGYQLIQAEVIAITNCAKGCYEIKTNTNIFYADIVVLALGHLNKYSIFPNNAQYITNPYANLHGISQINSNATVGIIGSKLTAVDFTILLAKRGIKQIHMVSRSGIIPQAQLLLYNGFSYKEYFWQVSHYRHLSLRNFIHIMEDFLGGKNQNIYSTEYQSGVSQFFDRSKYYIDRYWHMLSTFEKHIFLNRYRGLWMAYRHPMPQCNAMYIKKLLEKNILTVHANYKGAVFHSQQKKFILNLYNKELTVDVLIDATGTATDIQQLNVPLIRNLQSAGLIQPYKFGGIKINCETLQLDGHANIFVIGALTQGSLFYVSAVERLVVHASIITNNIMNTLRNSIQGLPSWQQNISNHIKQQAH